MISRVICVTDVICLFSFYFCLRPTHWQSMEISRIDLFGLYYMGEIAIICDLLTPSINYKQIAINKFRKIKNFQIDIYLQFSRLKFSKNELNLLKICDTLPYKSNLVYTVVFPQFFNFQKNNSAET